MEKRFIDLLHCLSNKGKLLNHKGLSRKWEGRSLGEGGKGKNFFFFFFIIKSEMEIDSPEYVCDKPAARMVNA